MKDAFNDSPCYKLLGIKVTDIRAGKSRIRMAFRRELTHLNVFLDEGAIASLAGCSLAMALLSLVEPNEGIKDYDN